MQANLSYAFELLLVFVAAFAYSTVGCACSRRILSHGNHVGFEELPDERG